MDYIVKKVKPFYVKATPDADFDPTAHIQIDYEEMEYQKQLQAGKTQKEIMTGQDLMAGSEDIEIKEIRRPHYYFIKYEPDCETLKNQFKKENILNKNGEYIKPQILNPNRVVPYFMVQCKLDDKPIEKLDYIEKINVLRSKSNII